MERILIMTVLTILSTTSAIMAAPQQSYGVPSRVNNDNNNFNRNQDTSGFQSFRNALDNGGRFTEGNTAALGSGIEGPKVFRHISLFIAPQEPGQNNRVRTIQAQGNPDKHINVIFIKAPSQSNSQQTEVILPEQPEQKTLVYVLVKKPEAAGNNVRIRGPPPTKPPAPAVYFIKYRDGNSNAAAGELNGQIQNSLSGGYQ
ncbi:hypothetical protein Ocin01_08955 [Orchesella cincta]|uniref:DUF243 domain-containing protein n=1 Tax=Orchesella cincta TaxID=48709 RepID=A0A1D2MXQ0_ORCCI|nr:hypothetical protein Ocin01_08955 [Orchesella cincta]